MDTNGEVNMCCNSFDEIINLNNLTKILCFLSLLLLSVHAADDNLIFSEQETGDYYLNSSKSLKVFL